MRVLRPLMGTPKEPENQLIECQWEWMVCYGSGGPVSRILSRAVICLGPARCRGHHAAYPRGRGKTSSAGRRPSAWPCSGWSLPCPECYHPGGALLPHLFTLTYGNRRYIFCGTGQGLPLPAVSRHPALWSSDFPLRSESEATAWPTGQCYSSGDKTYVKFAAVRSTD